MRWPWTSRERLADAQKEIAELKSEVRELRAKNEKLTNQIVWRHSNIALDPDLLPEQYRPKATATGDLAIPTNDTQRQVGTEVVGSGPMRLRATIRKREAEAEADFIRQTTGISTVPVTETPADRKAKVELLSKLNTAANEGVEAAKQSA